MVTAKSQSRPKGAASVNRCSIAHKSARNKHGRPISCNVISHLNSSSLRIKTRFKVRTLKLLKVWVLAILQRFSKSFIPDFRTSTSHSKYVNCKRLSRCGEKPISYLRSIVSTNSKTSTLPTCHVSDFSKLLRISSHCTF